MDEGLGAGDGVAGVGRRREEGGVVARNVPPVGNALVGEDEEGVRLLVRTRSEV